MLEPRAVARGHGHIGVEVEALGVGLALPAPRDQWRIGTAADSQQRLAGAHAGGDPAENRRAADARKKRRLARQPVRALDFLVRAIELDAIVGVVREIASRLDLATPNIDALFGLARLFGRVRGLYPDQE